MFNLKFNLVKKIKRIFFPFYKNQNIQFVFKKLQEDVPRQSKVAMFVGGCVRKHLLDEKINDIDIATSLTTEQVKEKFKDTKFNVIDSGIKHGTVTLVFEKLKLEITTLRKDVKTDGRHAEIEHTSNWTEDSERRDFTINAIYLDINGKFFDPQFGITDLKNLNVKFIGDPEKRIIEDYLRILRFIRFSLEYKSEIDHATIGAIKLNLDGIKKISKERILNELFKILITKNFVKLNSNKHIKDIFSLIFPELKYLERLTKLDTTLNQLNYDKKTLLATLLIDEKNNHEYFLHKYNVSNELKDNLDLLATNFIHCQKNKNFFYKDLKKNIYLFGKSNLKALCSFCFSSGKKLKLKDYLAIQSNIDKLNIPKFYIDGKYLKENGMEEGILMGKTLKSIENEWLDNDFKISNQRVLEIVKKFNN